MRVEGARPGGGDAGGAGPGSPHLTPTATTSSVLRIRRREEVYRELLFRFFVLIKTAQAGAGGTEEFDQAISEFMESLELCLAAESTLVIGERNGQLHVNAVRARIDAEAFTAQRFLVQTLVQCDFSGILFERGVDRDEVAAFLDVFLRPGTPARGVFDDLVDPATVRHIHAMLRVDKPEGIASDDESEQRSGRPGETRYFGRQTYFKSIFVLRHLLDGLEQPCSLDLREAKQVIQTIVEHVLEDEDAVIALDLIREWDRSLLVHSVKVAVLAFALGRRMGLGRRLLGELGVAALFHDVGRIQTASAKDGCAGASFRRLVMKGGRSKTMLRASLVAAERYWPKAIANPAGSGTVLTGSLFSRIVHLANRFEELTGSSSSGGRAMSPSIALEILGDDCGLDVDPAILAVLAAIIEEDSLRY